MGLRPAASSSFLVLIQEKKQKKIKAAAAASEDSQVRVGMGKWAEKFTYYFLRPITYPAKFPGLGRGLDLLLLLFFHQDKAPAGAAKFAGYMNGLVPGKLPCPGRGRMRYAPTSGYPSKKHLRNSLL